MSDQNYRAIRFLEYIKYRTVKRQKDTKRIEIIGFNGKGDSDTYISEDTKVVMPEGLEINFKLIRINWHGTVFDGDGNIINSDKAIYFELSNGTNGLMKENTYKDIIHNGVEYRRYIFNSNYYKEQAVSNPNGVMGWINTYDNINYINEYGGGDFPMSMVVIIKNDDQNRKAFEKFMNMGYTQWKGFFENMLANFMSYSNIDFFDMYPTQVIVRSLSKNEDMGIDNNSRLIKLLEKIRPRWDNGSISGTRRTVILFDILAQIKPENAKDILAEFLRPQSELFYTSINLFLDDDNKVRFIFLLMRLFYAKMSKEDLVAYENKIVNLPQKSILPFLFEEFNLDVKRGPYYEFEHGTNSLVIKNMTFWVYKPKTKNDKINISRPVNLSDPNENMFSYVHDLEFGYEETIGALACFDKPDQGFNQLMVYPIPAFAFPVFHDSLSDKYTLNDLLNELNTSACIIFPFFRIAQLEAITYNVISLIFGISGSILKDPIKNKIKESKYGLQFIYLYDILSNSWVGQDLGRAFLSGGPKIFMDCENLLAAWSLYFNSTGYIAMATVYPDEANGLKEYMEKVKMSYEGYKKKQNK